MSDLLQTKSAATIPRLLLSRREAAAALGVSVRLLDYLTADDLPCVRLRGRVLYDPADLIAWIEAHKRREGGR